MSEPVMKMMNRNGEWRRRKRIRRLHEWIAQEDFFFIASLTFHIMNEWMNEASEWMGGINKLLSLMMDIQRFRMLASECKLSSKLLCIWNKIFELRTWWLNGYELFRAFHLFLSSLPVLKIFTLKSGEVFHSDRLAISKQQILNRLNYAETWFISSFIRRETRAALKK